MNNNNEVTVKVCSFIDFFTNEAIYPVAIDTYQRPYVWNINKVQELINDLTEYLSERKGLSYYMGNVLLHQDNAKGKLYIIDGQQRLTTLSILYFVLYGKLLDGDKMAMEYYSPLSAQNIKNAQLLFENKKDEFKAHADELFSKISITFITTFNNDIAFTFFDTQNNRGVKLYSTDLLKSYHLRAIGNADNIKIQIDCASRWEKIQNYKTLFGQKKDFVAELFNQFLWRARVWRGQHVINRETDEDILVEFQKRTLQSESPDTIPLYPNQNNTFGQKLIIRMNNGYAIQPVNIENTNNSADLPFTLRQPINEGLGFFLFAKKYADLISYLIIKKDIEDIEINAFRNFYNQVWSNISIYLKELFILAVVMYYDKFESTKLLEFTLWLDHVLGAIRIEKQYVFREAPLKFLKGPDNNLLDIISQAFRPEEVILYLKEHKGINEKYENEEIERSKGVQGIYKDNILNYYGKSEFFHKASWITDAFVNEKRDSIWK
ncbi:DUF262 domain-containing protein [Clostridium sp. BL-8]|uniref:DUF262 domain-containing protein n=1 Tax=Clostridium sp. BL-8 TaxID=349938 RepID=UPI00098C1480|nr:DUF262 domain-containing protein [Clostridium sp. BL-8]OOM78817.1 hypothetical protein CLOBL_20650 [Clostridium sp. BL-8]